MRGELSHGLPWLATAGRWIVDTATWKPVLLRGVNRSGLEYTEPSDAGFLEAAGFNPEEISNIVSGWGANVIRVPFNQDWALRGRRGHSDESYLASLDQVISWASALSAYTILDLQWLDAETIYGHTRNYHGIPAANHIAPVPDAGSIVLWRELGARYRHEPAVIFDLFNEPHDRLSDDLHPIHVIGPGGEVVKSDARSVRPREWAPWATRLIAEVRRTRPRGIILVEGVDWGFDLRGIEIDAPDIVYSTHIYSNRKPSSWWRALGRSADVPIFVGEWGGTARDLNFGRKLADRLRKERLGWAAWSWADYPELIATPRAPGYEPTAFGELVRSELRAA